MKDSEMKPWSFSSTFNTFQCFCSWGGSSTLSQYLHEFYYCTLPALEKWHLYCLSSKTYILFFACHKYIKNTKRWCNKSWFLKKKSQFLKLYSQECKHCMCCSNIETKHSAGVHCWFHSLNTVDGISTSWGQRPCCTCWSSPDEEGTPSQADASSSSYSTWPSSRTTDFHTWSLIHWKKMKMFRWRHSIRFHHLFFFVMT